MNSASSGTAGECRSRAFLHMCKLVFDKMKKIIRNLLNPEPVEKSTFKKTVPKRMIFTFTSTSLAPRPDPMNVYTANLMFNQK
ncbi:hypothetical protein [Cohnella hongkongensis]|uniref:Uncharacterized protein n=1 Tax=Cohnella hongkongensis TaxID=178337 RepID=A0ABV9F518_9BACL